MVDERRWRQALCWVGSYPYWLTFDPEEHIRIDRVLARPAPADAEELEMLELAEQLTMLKGAKKH